MTTPQSPRNILMTIALIYANGEVHLGHITEAIQADIWARFQKSCGNNCIFLGGSDAHGTAVMLAAEKQGVTAEELIQRVSADQQQDYKNFLIEFEHFYSTHSPENQELVSEIYKKLSAHGDITTRTIEHAYDPEKNMFLADRFIKGECPNCGAPDQYGDNCEVCSSTYDVTALKNPKSVFSGATPIKKDSLHYFFNVSKYSDMLRKWIHSDNHVHPQMANKLDEWFKDGLREWDISRDAPYFGFEIPDAPGKYFYVWLDAPVGYLAILKNLCAKRSDIHFDTYWKKDSTAELYHFIGKDIVYFHSLFWPAMLQGADYRLPTGIVTHGYLTINGAKMSKSRGTFITVKQYLAHLNPEYLRYYLAAKLTSHAEDIDLNLADFALRVNADLVGKYVNLASRCAGFITKKFNGVLADKLHDEKLFTDFVTAGEAIAQHYEELNYSRVVREIMALADQANQYIDHHKPWALAKEPGRDADVQLICTQGLNLFKLLTIYLQPILPMTALRVAKFLNIDEMNWHNRQTPLLAHAINPFEPLMTRIAPETIAALSGQ